MRGALARSLSEAASSPQQVGTAQTLNSAETWGRRGENGGKRGGIDVAEDDWTLAAANLEERILSAVAAPDRPTMPPPRLLDG